MSSEAKTSAAESKNGKRTEGGGGGGGDAGAAGGGGGGPKYSMFTWFVVLALLGVWSSVAMVYFDIVDYDSVIGKAGGDFSSRPVTWHRFNVERSQRQLLCRQQVDHSSSTALEKKTKPMELLFLLLSQHCHWRIFRVQHQVLLRSICGQE